MATPGVTNKPSSTFSISLVSAKPKATAPTRPSSQPFGARGKKRSHGDSDDEDHDEFSQKVQIVTGFDAGKGGAISLDGDRETRGPLVIPALKNKNWREESLKRRNKVSVYLPPEAQQRQRVEGDDIEKVGGEVGDGVDKSKYGLQILKKKKKEEEEEKGGEDVVMKDRAESSGLAVDGDDTSTTKERIKTEDELALEALLAGENGVARKSNLILPMTNGDADWRDSKTGAISEEDAYKLDVASRPEAPSMEDYEAVPVEEFGAALLRGMGWKEGQEVGRRGGKEAKLKTVGKRPALLGLGAKSNNVIEELGSWGKGAAKGKKGVWVDKTYTPVVLKNKVTGEIVDVPAVEDKKRSENDSKSADRELEYRRKERPSPREYHSDRLYNRRSQSRDSEDRRRNHRNGDDRSYDKNRFSGRDRSRERNRDRDRERRDSDRESYKDRDYDRDRDGSYKRDRQRDRDRDYRRDRDKDSTSSRIRDRSREKGSRR